MDGSFNLIAVVVAALSAFLVGGLWYSPLLFMKAWQQDAGVETDADKQPHPAKVFGFAALFSLISCMVFSNFIVTGSGAVDGLLLGLQVGFGFVLCSFGINYQFANRPFRLIAIDGGYHTAQFALFGLILGGWPWS